jgi:hypothetical protein
VRHQTIAAVIFSGLFVGWSSPSFAQADPYTTNLGLRYDFFSHAFEESSGAGFNVDVTRMLGGFTGGGGWGVGGGIDIEHFAMGNLGAGDMEVSFKGDVEPISMQLLAKAFGWPEFSGKLAASIPGVTLKNNVLTFDGNVESEVFGGKITGSNIRLQDPLGNFPQLFADVRARNLDLGLVTNTFEVGSITGKLEADVLGLQLFGWSPVAFNARLATPKGDKSRHRISAKAVSSLSNVGGGGGGVVQALQSGVLKFFDEYSYDRLGIACRLRDDVCEMSGIEPAGVGYYIVKGAGIPRIDIVGNSGRVRWSQLLSSIPTDASNVTVQ